MSGHKRCREIGPHAPQTIITITRDYVVMVGVDVDVELDDLSQEQEGRL